MDLQNHILVPTDLTEAADRAIEYGIELAKRTDSGLGLIHILPQIPGSEEVKKMMSGQLVFRNLEEKLNAKAKQIKQDHKLDVDSHLKEGSIFEHITKAAKELGSKMIVIGTHGKKGIQYITGSFLGKVIAGSHVPVLVVKRESTFKPIQNVIVALDFNGNMEKVVTAGLDLAQAFGAKIILHHPESISPDKKAISGKLSEAGIEHTFIPNPLSGKPFVSDIFSQADQNEGAIVVFNLEENDYSARIKRLERLITRNQTVLPVVYVNSGD